MVFSSSTAVACNTTNITALLIYRTWSSSVSGVVRQKSPRVCLYDRVRRLTAPEDTGPRVRVWTLPPPPTHPARVLKSAECLGVRVCARACVCVCVEEAQCPQTDAARHSPAASVMMTMTMMVVMMMTVVSPIVRCGQTLTTYTYTLHVPYIILYSCRNISNIISNITVGWKKNKKKTIALRAPPRCSAWAVDLGGATQLHTGSPFSSGGIRSSVRNVPVGYCKP